MCFSLLFSNALECEIAWIWAARVRARCPIYKVNTNAFCELPFSHSSLKIHPKTWGNGGFGTSAWALKSGSGTFGESTKLNRFSKRFWIETHCGDKMYRQNGGRQILLYLCRFRFMCQWCCVSVSVVFFCCCLPLRCGVLFCIGSVYYLLLICLFSVACYSLCYFLPCSVRAFVSFELHVPFNWFLSICLFECARVSQWILWMLFGVRRWSAVGVFNITRKRMHVHDEWDQSRDLETIKNELNNT